MRDDRVITLIEHWQEAPLHYSGPCSLLPTALNNHAGKHLLGLKPGQSLSCDRPSQALPIDKWACPSIEIVKMQQATSAVVIATITDL